MVVPQLQWIPGDTAVYHNLYFGTNSEPGPAEYILQLPKNINIYHPTAEFEPGITYYWRVDEVEADGTIRPGTVWNFTFGAKASNPDPANGAVDVNLPLLQWTGGASVKAYNVYFGRQGAELEQLNLEEWSNEFHFIPFDKQLEPGATYEWRVDEILDNGEEITGEVWRFTTTEQEPLPSVGVPKTWWTFDEGAGLEVGDAVGTLNGRLSVAPGFGPREAGPTWKIEIGPRMSAALMFDGENDYVEVDNNEIEYLFDGRPFSIFAWVQGGGPNQVIASQGGE